MTRDKYAFKASRGFCVSRIIRVRREYRAVHAVALCLSLGWPATIPQSTDDPLSGRWILNVERTHYGGGADARQRETFDCVRDRTVVECRIESLRAGGRRVVGGFTAAYDGPAGSTRGIPDVDQVRLTKVSASIADATFTYQGRAVFAYRAVRSTNGRSLTVISVDAESDMRRAIV